MFTIYGDRQSGNCLKVLYAARHLGLEHAWEDVNVLEGESRTPESLARNPAGQVPYVVFNDHLDSIFHQLLKSPVLNQPSAVKASALASGRL